MTRNVISQSVASFAALGESTRAQSISMTDHLIGEDDLLATFSQQRQVLLKHTADLLCPEPAPVRQTPVEREAKLSAILVSSLEELKVAEEELLERTEALASVRDELEERIGATRQLFDLAPACLLVTDIYGNIVDANRAFQVLLRQDIGALERQPLARFIPADERRGFRDGLTRVVAADGVGDWRLTLARPTDARVTVSATVQVVRSVGVVPQVRLFWSFGPLGSENAPMNA